jgi:hypothetical protein
MNMSIRTGFGFGLALYLIAGGPSPAQSASPPNNLGVEPDRDGQYVVGSATDEVGRPTGRTMIRIIAPDDREQLGTILFGIPDYGPEPTRNWGGPR